MSSPSIVPASVVPPAGLKRLILRSAAFGVGFAAALSLIVGGWNLYANRPKPPKPWNNRAITATYRNVQTGNGSKVKFNYVLANNTDTDYRIDSTTAHVAMKIDSPDTYAPFGHYVELDSPIFIPARRNTVMVLTLDSLNPPSPPTNASDEEREKYRTALEGYLSTKEVIKGFVLLDESTRYEIDFPPGWKDHK